MDEKDFAWFDSPKQSYLSHIRIPNQINLSIFLEKLKILTTFKESVDITCIKYKSASFKFDIHSDDLDTVDQYYVKIIKPSDEFEEIEPTIKSSPFSNFTLRGLEPNTTYRFQYRISRKISQTKSICTAWVAPENIYEFTTKQGR